MMEEEEIDAQASDIGDVLPKAALLVAIHAMGKRETDGWWFVCRDQSGTPAVFTQNDIVNGFKRQLRLGPLTVELSLTAQSDPYLRSGRLDTQAINERNERGGISNPNAGIVGRRRPAALGGDE